MKLNLLRAFGVTAVVLLLLWGLFGGGPEPRMPQERIVAAGRSNLLELRVINVNPVIARQFRLRSLSGVLLAERPRGTAKRTIDLKRGDILLKYNGIPIQSADHLADLMSRSRPGETIVFTITRDGRELTVSTRIPQSLGPFERTRWDILIVLGILTLVFASLFMDWIHRTVCVTVGATAMVAGGTWLGFYDQTRAFDSIKISPILIFVGMSVFSVLLEQLRFLDYVAKKVIVRMNADVENVVLALCFVTYVFSLFINNLSTILVIIPITLYITRGLGINPVPVLIAQIIASNIGGASTIIGDFPNMLIASATGLLFQDFLIFMAPICFLLLLSLFWYMRQFNCIPQRRRKSPGWEDLYLRTMTEEVARLESTMDWRAVKRVLWVLGGLIVALLVLPFFRLQSATIALAGGFMLLAVENERAKEVLRRISLSDVLFFLSLFILVGGAVHSGLLRYIAETIDTLSVGSGVLYCLLLMWLAAFVTAFLNAGPTTVFLIPVAANTPLAGTNDAVIWWSLSLGVLAGSSATLSGATAGIVTQTLLEENRSSERVEKGESHLTFMNYSRTGLPVSLMFLCLSSIYILILCGWMGVR